MRQSLSQTTYSEIRASANRGRIALSIFSIGYQQGDVYNDEIVNARIEGKI